VDRRLCVSALSTWNWTLDEDLAFYRRAGVGTIGAAFSKTQGREDDVRAAGVAVHHVIGVGQIDLVHRDAWDHLRARLDRAASTAARLGAGYVVLGCGAGVPMTWEESARALAELLGPVVQQAQEHGVELVLEPTNPLRVDVSFVHTLGDVLDLARRLDVGVCMDVQACWAERELGAIVHEGVDRIRLVQVSDYVVGSHSTPDRAVPGDGDMPLRRILGDLLEAGYQGPFDLELIGPRIEAEGYEPAIRRAADHVGALLSELAPFSA
jgi:sugar phosphate isomerase/epimerase